MLWPAVNVRSPPDTEYQLHDSEGDQDRVPHPLFVTVNVVDPLEEPTLLLLGVTESTAVLLPDCVTVLLAEPPFEVKAIVQDREEQLELAE